MSSPSVIVNNLSKAYRIGLKDQKYNTFGDAIVSFIKSPVSRFKNLKSLSSFDFTKEDESTFWALRDLSFSVQEGDALGVIGKNGAGKSTLLKILAKITDPTEGEIKIRGRVAALLEVGTGFNPELTGRENTYLNGSILGMTKKEIDRKFDEIVAFSDVEKFLDTPVKRYSSGMRVRLGFAVAAHLDPEILIVDEVLAVGDAEFQRKCIGKMQDISANSGKTIIFVSHDMTAISKLTNRSILLEGGRLKSYGPTEEVVLDYNKVNEQSFHDTKDVATLKRTGDLEIQVVNYWLDGNLNSNAIKEPGEGIELMFELNKPVLQPTKLGIFLTFFNSMNTPVFTVSSFYDKEFVDGNSKGQLIRCYIPELKLTPDTYHCTWWMMYNNGFSERIDYLFSIRIKEMDYFNTGYTPAFRKHGSLLLASNWELNNK